MINSAKTNLPKSTCEDNLMSNIYAHSHYICSTCEYNICSIWIAKNLVIQFKG